MTRNWAKVAASVGYGTIKYTYLTETLFNNISNRTVAIAKTIKTESGKPLFDDFAITQTDRYLLFRQFTRDAIRKVFNTVRKLVHSVSDSLFITEDDSVDADQLGFSLNDYEAYDDNILDDVDTAVLNCLVYYILMEWYKYKNLPDFAALFNKAYIESDIDLNLNCAELLKRTI